MTPLSTDAAALAASARDQAYDSNPDVDAQTLLLAEVAIRLEDVSARLAMLQAQVERLAADRG
jgi:uncharacterized small protein (DUF1192 family)